MVVQQVSEMVTVGLNEQQCQKILKEEFKKCGVKKFWHPSKFRIGEDTVKNFGESADQSLQIKEGDIFSIDVGPVIGDHEADFGQSFIFNPYLKADDELVSLNNAAMLIWNETAKQWRQNKLSGVSLYQFAVEFAKKLGYRMNSGMGGHRLGDFPHALFSKKKLVHFDQTPAQNLWVLEVHLISDQLKRAAFFEDILTLS